MRRPDPSSISVLLAEVCYSGKLYQTIVSETRDGQTKSRFKGGPPAHLGGNMLPLYAGNMASKEPNK